MGAQVNLQLRDEQAEDGPEHCEQDESEENESVASHAAFAAEGSVAVVATGGEIGNELVVAVG